MLCALCTAHAAYDGMHVVCCPWQLTAGPLDEVHTPLDEVHTQSQHKANATAKPLQLGVLQHISQSHLRHPCCIFVFAAGEQVNATGVNGMCPTATVVNDGKWCAPYPGTNQACVWEFADHKCRERRGPCEYDAFCK